MSKPFLIRHPDGTEYELTDMDLFVREYQPQGFVIATKNVPHELEIPVKADVKAAKDKVKADGAAEHDTTDADPGAGDSKSGPDLHADHASG